MAGLGETTAMLARMRRAARKQAQAPAASPRGMAGVAEVAPSGDNPGKLRMFFYAPNDLPRGAAMVVLLHGCGQSAGRHAADSGWIELARRSGFAVLAPEQTITNNLNRCFNWFSPKDIERGRGEAASIAEMVTQAITEHPIDPGRVVVTGLSAGGAMTAVMLATYPELFAGGAVIAGIAYGVAQSLTDGIRAMRQGDGRDAAALGDLVRRATQAARRPGLRLSIWQGDADTVVSPDNAREIASQWADVLGLPPDPESVSAPPGVSRSVWGGASAGDPAVELNIVHGLGHGTPLSTTRPEDVGSPAPFMLEAGVSSTLEIARFWGLTDSPAPAAAASQLEAASPRDRIKAPLSQRLAAGLRKAADGALRATRLKK